MPRTALLPTTLLLAALSTPLHAAAPDGVVARVPVAAPGPAPARPGLRAAGLPDLAARLAAADVDGALEVASTLSHHADARTAAAASLTLGVLQREAGRWEASRAAMAEVRALGGPLVPWAAWFEAEALLELGRPEEAATACEAYARAWPKGRHVSDCEELRAFALARAGRDAEARTLAARWDAAHPQEAIGEQIALDLALRRATTQPSEALPELQRLAVDHTLPSTGRRAESALERLRSEGLANAELPTHLPALMARAESLRAARRTDEAWALFWSLAARAHEDAALAAWVEANTTRFAQDTRRHAVLIGWWQRRVQDDAEDASASYELFRALERAGRYVEAFELGRSALGHWSDGGLWAEAAERVARDGLLARRYAEAIPIFDHLATERGATGERNRYYGAFAAVMAGDPSARARLDRGIEEGSLLTEHRYWRAKLVAATDPALAAQDHAWILAQDPASWYANLLRSSDCGDAPEERRGTFPLAQPSSPDLPRPITGLAPILSLPTPSPFGDAPPSQFHDPLDARARFEDVVTRYASAFPELLAVRDLVDAGLYDLSGPLFGDVVDAWRAANRRGEGPARDWSRRTDTAGWRALHLHTRNFADLTRLAWGLGASATPEERTRVDALALPLAHGRQVWHHAETHDVDPLLVLGLMRTESMFDAHAVSPVGARGPMQIMPRTGHLLADLDGDPGFHPGRLHDPDTAIGYGVGYLGLLLERFDGAWPLAVAAYNGGPHNVSAWLQALGPDVPMDVFVEHIPWKETRRYVRTVSERYGDYLAIYAPGEHLHVPATPSSDDPSVVDF